MTAETQTAGGAARLGAELRATREALGWTLPALAESLRIRRAYLEAIEQGRVGELPGTTYALGFVRTYASALGLSGEEVAQRFRNEAGEVNRKPELSFPVPVPQRGVPAGAVILLGFVIAIGAYVAWYRYTETRHTPVETVPPIPERMAGAAAPMAPSPPVATMLPSAAPPAARPPGNGVAAAGPGVAGPGVAGPGVSAPGAAAPGAVAGRTGGAATAGGTAAGGAATGVPSPSSPAAGAPAAPAAVPPPSTASTPTAPDAGTPPSRVLLRFTADAWITVKQKGGPALVSKLMHAGETFPVPDGRSGLTLTTGNAGGTEILVDGAPGPALGGSGMVRRDVPLDPDVLKSGRLPPPRSRSATPPAAAADTGD